MAARMQIALAPITKRIIHWTPDPAWLKELLDQTGIAETRLTNHQTLQYQYQFSGIHLR